jgi:hypothetical protein
MSALPYWQRNPKYLLVSAWLTEEGGDRFDFPCHSAARPIFVPAGCAEIPLMVAGG